MAKPNYQFEKRQRDLAKKRKQEEKQEEKRRQKLADKPATDTGDDIAANPTTPMPAAADTTAAAPQNGEATSGA